MVGRIFIFLAVFFCISLTFSQQANRERPDSTDTLVVNPLIGLHYIELSIEKDVFDQKGITDQKPSDNYYFRVEGDDDYTKVSHFGDNLSDYLTNVEPAYDVMSSYRNLKMAHSGLFWGGILLAAAGAVLFFPTKEISPTLFIGLGTFSLSWMPEYFSRDKIPEAVGIFNQSIGKYQASNSSFSSSPQAP